MKRVTFVLICFLFFLLSLVIPNRARAITISYDATNLGSNLWQYSYQVSNFTSLANQDIAIYFDRNLYASLQDPPPAPNTDWSPFVLQPDPSLPADGEYDVLALVNNASLADPFTVSFSWLGSGTPGFQLFDVMQFDPSGNYLGTITSGQTVPLQSAVPEPGTLLLLGSGLLGIFGLKNLQKSRTKQ